MKRFVLLLVSLYLIACSSNTGNSDTDSLDVTDSSQGTDTLSDADTGTDSDTTGGQDTGTDSDSESEHGTDIQDDSDSSDDTETETDTETESETESDTISEADFSGTYNGVFGGDETGLLTLAINTQGHLIGTAIPWDTPQGQGECDLSGEGGAVFSISGQEEDVTYEGQFRFDGGNRFAFGSWSTVSGKTGIWGAWHQDNAPHSDASNQSPACNAYIDVCQPVPQESCMGSISCQAGFFASKSALCGDLYYTRFLNPLTAISDPGECAAIGSEDSIPQDWIDNECPYQAFRSCHFTPACMESTEPQEGDCSNTIDDDTDALADCDDPDCIGTTACDTGGPVDWDLGTGMNIDTDPAFTGCTVGKSDDFTLDNGEDLAFRFQAGAAGGYSFDTYGSYYDTNLRIMDGTCTQELDGDDDAAGTELSDVDMVLTENQEVCIVVDGRGRQAGTFSLNIYPTETCTGGVDDDHNGFTDCDDPWCFGHGDCPSRPCPDTDLLSQTGTPVHTGTTDGEGNDYAGAGPCRGDWAEDVVFSWTAPETGTYIIDTLGSEYDTVLYLLDGSCDGPQLACCDDEDGGTPASSISQSVTSGQTLYIVVDGYNTQSGNYILNIEKVL